jgi:hypothetical protein
MAANSQIVNGPDSSELVWSIMDNAYVTRGYWEWVNGRGCDHGISSTDTNIRD